MEEIAVPKALIAMLNSSNARINDLKRRMWADFQDANEEMMKLLQLDPEAGWRLDLERLVYIKSEQPPEPPE